MAVSILKKCNDCRYPCKTDKDDTCKFEPKDSTRGYPHFKDPKDWGKHEKNSRMCVVCKEWFNYAKIKWVKEPEGYYSMCSDCAETHYFILKSCVRVKADLPTHKTPQKANSMLSKSEFETEGGQI